MQGTGPAAVRELCAASSFCTDALAGVLFEVAHDFTGSLHLGPDGDALLACQSLCRRFTEWLPNMLPRGPTAPDRGAGREKLAPLQDACPWPGLVDAPLGAMDAARAAGRPGAAYIGKVSLRAPWMVTCQPQEAGLLAREGKPEGADRVMGRAELFRCILHDAALGGMLAGAAGPGALQKLSALSRTDCSRLCRPLGPALEKPCERARRVCRSSEPSPDDGSLQGTVMPHAGGGCLALLQDIWLNLALANTLTSTMGATTVHHFRAASRASRECMRGVFSKALVRRPNGVQRHSNSSAVNCHPSACQAYRESACGSSPRSVAEDPLQQCNGACQVQATGHGSLAFLQDIWQYLALANSLTAAMGPTDVRQFRAISRAGRECMRGTCTGMAEKHGRGELQPSTARLRQAHCAQVARLQSTSGLPTLAETLLSASRFPRPALLRHGQLVRLCGLQEHQDLNGTEGRLGQYNVGSGRWEVVLANGKATRVREDNVWPIAKPMGCDASLGEVARPAATSRPSRSAAGPSRRLLVCGGCDGRQALCSTDCLHPEAGEWTGAPLMRRQHDAAVSAVVGNSLYVIGGSSSSEASSASVERFDPTAWCWQTMPPMSMARSFAVSAVIEGCIYVCGGGLTYQWALSSAERFDPALRIWQTLPSMSRGRSCAVAEAIGGQLYVCAGFDMEAVDTSEAFDPKLHAWRALPRMPQIRSLAASAVLGGQLFLCGGFSETGEHLRSVVSLDTGDEAWQVMPPMSQARASASAAVSPAGRLFVCGGSGGAGAGARLGSVESFDPAARAWEAQQPMRHRRAVAIAVVADGYLYIFGGSSGKAVLGSAERLDLGTGTWEALESMSVPRIGAVCALLTV